MFKQFPGELASSPVSDEKTLWGWARSWEASKGGGLLWGGWLYFTDARQRPPSWGGGLEEMGSGSQSPVPVSPVTLGRCLAPLESWLPHL